ncbi:MAG: DUF2797 domain-containing protein [Leptospiraceae bacterium]|nr:DUF2797 domain-containing protein [Leptospiraceae bacterium]MCP5493963.1 DUF2797 domain-containing protein [Leptospiraceae bacterium]
MILNGYLRMLKHQEINPVKYFLVLASYQNEFPVKKETEVPIKTSEYDLTTFLNKKLTISFQKSIRCLHCASLTKKSYNQGYCYPCFIRLAKNDMCILKPETCHYHKGTCREPEWGKENCFRQHTVYLANTSGIKVGITKENPITKRWVDQGAVEALAVIKTENRLDAGILENELKKYIADKTSWQKMVSTQPEPIDLKKHKYELLEKLKNLKTTYTIEKDEKLTNIYYPIEKYPSKKISYKLKESLPIEDVLVGIKGQYLLFEKGVLNIRSHAGYLCGIEISD